jgi:hypothetical protein
VLGALLAACGPSDPCRSAAFRELRRTSLPYADDWIVARGDTLTLPQMGDRFRLRRMRLDTTTAVVGKGCQFTGALVFDVPKRDTFAVTWFGQAGSIAQAGRVIVIGWPADLGPFSGIEAMQWGDSLVGNLLFDARLGIRVKPGVTAQFVAGRPRPPTHPPAR